MERRDVGAEVVDLDHVSWERIRQKRRETDQVAIYVCQ
jgi:hypothetical protein